MFGLYYAFEHRVKDLPIENQIYIIGSLLRKKQSEFKSVITPVYRVSN